MAGDARGGSAVYVPALKVLITTTRTTTVMTTAATTAGRADTWVSEAEVDCGSAAKVMSRQKHRTAEAVKRFCVCASGAPPLRNASRCLQRHARSHHRGGHGGKSGVARTICAADARVVHVAVRGIARAVGSAKDAKSAKEEPQRLTAGGSKPVRGQCLNRRARGHVCSPQTEPVLHLPLCPLRTQRHFSQTASLICALRVLCGPNRSFDGNMRPGSGRCRALRRQALLRCRRNAPPNP